MGRLKDKRSMRPDQSLPWEEDAFCHPQHVIIRGFAERVLTFSGNKPFYALPTWSAVTWLSHGCWKTRVFGRYASISPILQHAQSGYRGPFCNTQTVVSCRVAFGCVGHSAIDPSLPSWSETILDNSCGVILESSGKKTALARLVSSG